SPSPCPGPDRCRSGPAAFPSHRHHSRSTAHAQPPASLKRSQPAAGAIWPRHDEEPEAMRVTDRLRRTGVAAAGGGGAGGAVAPPGGATPAARPGPGAAGTGAAAPPASGNAVASYAAAVRAVLPSVVLIRTADGLGSGVVLDRAGNIVTNAHVAGQATA